MSTRSDARPHLDKAEEYLESARLVLAHGSYNAACSLAVTSGINSKDVICLLSVGHTNKSDNHDKAVEELRRSGPVGQGVAPTMGKLLSKKTKSQYLGPSVTVADADAAVKRAERLFGVAKELFNSTK